MRKFQPPKPQRGFSLLELLVIIVGTAAIPNLLTYMDKAQFSVVVSASYKTKAAITAYYIEQGSMPTGANAAQFSVADHPEKGVDRIVVTSINEQSIIIDATAAALAGSESGLNWRLAGKTVRLIGQANKGLLSWRCESNAKQKYLPRSCVSDKRITAH